MAAPIIIRDPSGKKSAKVVNGGSLLTINEGVPPFGLEQKQVIYRDYFRNTVTSGANGSQDMRVNGSTTPVEFKVSGLDGRDRYISSISFEITDASATLDRFGSLAALTNGIEIEYTNPSVAGVVSLTPITLKTNFDFIRLCQGTPAFGDGATVFRASNVRGNSEGYIPDLDLRAVFGLHFGIRLTAADSLVIRINDNVSSIDGFTAIASGFDRLKISD